MDKQITQNTEEKGREIYASNPHFRKIANIMEHPEFREFFNQYMSDWETAKTVIMFMKIYEAIEKHSLVELSPYQKIAIVKDVIDNNQKRKEICEALQLWTNSSNFLLDNKNHNEN